jgi:ribosomal protein S18 acetylase RimI-like enzyme
MMMQPITSEHEILEGIDRVKKAGRKLVTNFFLNPRQAAFWIRQELLFSVTIDTTFFLFRRHGDFHYLYFTAPDAASLREPLARVARGTESDLVIDLVGSEEMLRAYAGIPESAGFSVHEKLIRMSRTGVYRPEKPVPPINKVVYATREDIELIHRFLEERLDKYSEQIASTEELEMAVKGQSILLVKEDGGIGGLLYFEQNGAVSHLKEWHVNEAFRGQHAGSDLIRHYFGLCASARKFILWVKSNNRDTISRYHHYGYREEPIADIIYLKLKEHEQDH